MVARLDNLPDEPEVLKALVCEQQAEIARLQEYVNVLLAKRYGPSSEKVPDEQLRLFNEAEHEAPEPEPESVPQQTEVVDTFELLVEFDFDKSNIKSVFKPQFDEIAQVLTESPDISMTIEGHTDWIGTDEYNQGLSERRANAVKTKFVQDYGIDANRISTVGYGEKRPIADNNTSAGRQKNRRAISVILRPRIVTE